MSGTPLHLLLVEDSEDDAASCCASCGAGATTCATPGCRRAEELEARRWRRGPWDIIISDYSLPRFDGLAAFAQVQRRGAGRAVPHRVRGRSARTSRWRR